MRHENPAILMLKRSFIKEKNPNKILMEKIKEYRKKNPTAKWSQIYRKFPSKFETVSGLRDSFNKSKKYCA